MVKKAKVVLKNSVEVEDSGAIDKLREVGRSNNNERKENRLLVWKKIEEKKIVEKERTTNKMEAQQQEAALEEKKTHLEGAVYFDGGKNAEHLEKNVGLEAEAEEMKARIGSEEKFKGRFEKMKQVCEAAHTRMADMESSRNRLFSALLSQKSSDHKLTEKSTKLEAELKEIDAKHVEYKRYTPFFFVALDFLAKHIPNDTQNGVKRRIDRLASPKVRQELLAPSIDFCATEMDIDALINLGTKAPPTLKKVKSESQRTRIVKPKRIQPEETDRQIEELVKKKLKKADGAEKPVGEKAADSIHGKKVKTIREMQQEQMEKNSVKEKAALLKKEDQLARSVIKEKAAVLKMEDKLKRERQAEKIEKKTDVMIMGQSTPPLSPNSRLAKDLELSPSPEKKPRLSPSIEEHQVEMDDYDDRLIIDE